MPDQLRTRAASVQPSTLNEKARTVEVVWSTGERVLRQGFDGPFFEELSLDPRHVRMGRLQSGSAPVLNSHQGHDVRHVIGVVERASLRDGEGVATLRFAEGDEVADSIFSKIAQGVVRNNSVGYKIHRTDPPVANGNGEPPTVRVTDWEPHEISIVPLGADPNARVRSQGVMPEITPPHQNRIQLDTSQSVEAFFVEQCRNFHLSIADADAFIRRNCSTLDEARAALIDHLARRDAQLPPNAGPTGAPERDRVHGSSHHELRSQMAEGLYARMSGTQPSQHAAPFARMSLTVLGRELLSAHGVSTRTMSDSQVVGALLEQRSGFHTTSDFPGILGDVANKTLQSAYEEARSGIIAVARRGTINDFKPTRSLQVDNFPDLTQVLEHGEFQRATITEGGETFQLATFGRVFSVSRQALVNDDLDALSRAMQSGGRAAARLIADRLVAALESTANMADGFPVFHASHNNIGTPGAISLTTVSEAVEALRTQTSPDGHVLNLEPRYLIVAPKRETEGRQFVADITPATSSDVQPYRLSVVVDARLAADPWYVGSEPTPGGLRYFELSGEAGPFVETRVGFDIDGVETKIRLDLAAGIDEYRTLFRNAGV
ncbi:MAG: hypothetical protein GEV06_01475 [Luteitalea sp.]|nr:hypothetical protein [Luteitalea sp.]